MRTDVIYKKKCGGLVEIEIKGIIIKETKSLLIVKEDKNMTDLRLKKKNIKERYDYDI